jgi:hypothetical protein
LSAADAIPGRTSHALDLLNFFLADVRDGLGWIVVAAGYHAAFISLGIVAASGLALYATAMPETGPNAPGNGGLTQASALPRTGERRG